jgi:hypothetical protein
LARLFFEVAVGQAFAAQGAFDDFAVLDEDGGFALGDQADLAGIVRPRPYPEPSGRLMQDRRRRGGRPYEALALPRWRLEALRRRWRVSSRGRDQTA